VVILELLIRRGVGPSIVRGRLFLQEILGNRDQKRVFRLLDGLRWLLLGGVLNGYQIGDLLLGYHGPAQHVLLLAELDKTVEPLVHISALWKSIILHPLKTGVK
jgi:hypothetical protein